MCFPCIHSIAPWSKKNDDHTETFLKRIWSVLDYEQKLLNIVGGGW